MKIRNVLFGIALTIAMAASIGMQPAAAVTQDDNNGNNTLLASVTVNVSGVFDAYFCNPPGDTYGSLGTVNLTSTSPLVTTQTGSLSICYDDTKPARPQFRTWVIANNFSNGTDTIPATGFKITKAFWVGQTQWSSGHGGGIGDIGAVSPTGSLNSPVVGTCPVCHIPWTTLNGLDNWKYVQYGWAGKGTADGTGFFPGFWASGWAPLGAVGILEVTLDVPVATPAGTYTSLVTLEVNFTAP